MSQPTNPKILVALGAIAGSILTLGIYSLLAIDSSCSPSMSMDEEQKEPLYWVAPMDSNYRRDKPGQSPMGMDLVPVYADGGTGDDAGPGTIKISPEVVNNLGVRTAKAEMKALASKIKTVGYVMYDQDKIVHIHPRVEGWIEKLYVKAAGDPISEGQPLYEIYSPALVNAQEEYLLALERKNKRLIKAAEDRLSALQLPAQTIKKLKRTRRIRQTVTFYTPQSGVIDNLNIREGFFVKPGTNIMSIGQLDQVWVEAEIYERQSSDVKAGLPVTMTLAYLPGMDWQGTVDYVYPTLDPKTRTVKVRLRFENKNHQLKPNMFAHVTIHVDTTSKSLLVPKESVIRTGSADRVVLALGGGRFKSIEVKVGRFDEQSAEILAGLDEGELVVSSAQFLLDSESSKSSDFKRMHHPLEVETVTQKVSYAEAEGVINNIMLEDLKLNISRGPIVEWDRPAATLDFLVSKVIDLENIVAKDKNQEGLKAGTRIQFTFYVQNGEFVITEIYPQRANVNDKELEK